MGVKVREKRGKLYLDIYIGGKRTWESLHLTLTQDRAQNKELWKIADLCRSKRETQLLTGAWNIQDPVSGKKKFTVYLKEFSALYKKPQLVGSLIGHIEESGGGNILLAQISPKWVEDFQNYLLAKARKEEMAQNSVAHYCKILRSALNKAAAKNIINHNPAAGVPRIPSIDTDMIFLNINEIQKLADTKLDGPYGAEIRRAFLFACYTGLRVSDLETITWGRIETNPMQIIKSQEKTKSPVYIPLGPSAQKLIFDGREHDPGERVFNLAEHKREASYDYLKEWAEKAKIKKRIGWHTARRTFATLALENGVDPITVAKLLGHKNLDQVMKYAKATDKLKREAIAALPEVSL